MQTSFSVVWQNPWPLCAFTFFFACVHARAAPSQTSQEIWEDFSGEKALAQVQQLVDFGPRPSGSEAIETSRAYITGQLEKCGWSVARQQFSDETPQGKVSFVNLIARFGKPIPKVEPSSLFLLCS